MKTPHETPEELNEFVDWLYGKETANGSIGSLSRFVQSEVTRRPAVGGQPRWANFAALRTINAYHRFFVAADLETAIAAFRADVDG